MRLEKAISFCSHRGEAADSLPAGSRRYRWFAFLVSYNDPYGGAPHAFSVFGTDRYRQDADTKLWKRLTEFLDQILH